MDIEQIVREEARRLVGEILAGKPLTTMRTARRLSAALPATPWIKPPAKKKAKAKLVHRQPTNAETNVLAALANGHETAGAIAAYTEGVLNARQAGQTLKRLVDQGLVTKQGERRFTTYHAVAQNGAAS